MAEQLLDGIISSLDGSPNLYYSATTESLTVGPSHSTPLALPSRFWRRGQRATPYPVASPSTSQAPCRKPAEPLPPGLCFTRCPTPFVMEQMTPMPGPSQPAAAEQSDGFTCGLCGRNHFKNDTGVWLHILKVHKERAGTFCGLCLRPHRSLQELAAHLQAAHPERGGGGEGEHECGLCGRNYLSERRLRSHIEIHRGH